MRYIVIEHNDREPSSPKVKVFASRRRAVSYFDDSPNERSLYLVSMNLVPREVSREDLGYAGEAESRDQH